MKPEDELKLNRKLAEWAGFKYDKTTTTGLVMETGWGDPRGRVLHSAHPSCLPKFTHSFDSCKCWLIPKLDSTVNIRSINFHVMGHTVPPNIWACEIIFFLGQPDDIYARRANSIPLSFCLAVEKFIDTYKEGKK